MPLFPKIAIIYSFAFLCFSESADSLVQFTKQTSSQCINVFEKYKTAKAAKDACIRNNECKGFEDNGCDGSGTYHLCKTIKTEHCVYKKDIFCPRKCYQCQTNGNPKPCKQYCSRFNICGIADAWKDGGTNCTACEKESLNQYSKYFNRKCMVVESYNASIKSLKKAKQVCSTKEKCSGIQIDKCDETHKVRLCTSTIDESLTKSSCVYKKANCSDLPHSMNGLSFQKGCQGAVWSDNSSAREYCQNDDGRYWWWEACCDWSGKDCVPKVWSNANSVLGQIGTIGRRKNVPFRSQLFNTKEDVKNVQLSAREVVIETKTELANESDDEITSQGDKSENMPDSTGITLTIVLFSIIFSIMASIIICLVYSKLNLKSQRSQSNNEFSGETLISEYPDKGIFVETSDSRYAESNSRLGTAPAFNPNQDIKRQAKLLPYNTKRDIPRTLFTVTDRIGFGNFGEVCKGELIGLYSENSRTTVAIKSINGPAEGTELRDFLHEIKIMSYIKPHLNVVSMIGSCCSDTQHGREMYLLIEFCPYGDLRTYLIDNKNLIISNEQDDTLNNRCLIHWTYEVAKGMEYLTQNKIMHGDLAARNILLDESLIQSAHPVAKIADFGLSKKFYDNTNYDKEARVYVPWKWMALEYLKNDYFTLTSDVWSFGIVLWEILSFCRVPYGHQEYDEVLKKLEEGYRLPCPDDINIISNWSPRNLYEDVTKECFTEDPKKRGTFLKTVAIIENHLKTEELLFYTQLTEKYHDERSMKYMKLGQI